MNELNINEYKYNLPQEKIALYPLAERDQSKLLIYRDKKITHSHFHQLDQFLPGNSILFFNDTKVIPARLHFQKDTGAGIEIFLLNPVSPSPLVAVAMEAQGSSQWHVVVGNAKRWTEGMALVKKTNDIELTASYIDKEKQIVQFEWSPPNLSFAEIISRTGATPLPPYLKRKVEASDRERYQTVYSKKEGAVAAPTAGLHFTDRVFAKLKTKNIATDFLTLHVSAGTFQPVKADNALEHTMHAEQMVISKNNLRNLLKDDRMIVAVGTTSLRTMESLYWYGVKLKQNPKAEFVIDQNDPYQPSQPKLSKKESIEIILEKMEKDDIDTLLGKTSIYVVPGYQFKTCEALITNFHQPGSTLMLLVAAFVGDDWKKVYQQAFENNYRFLSYGDSSLLFRRNTFAK
jgi:S-adenosylmethionine:tRNA ribosyltransferase-isomerase